MSVRVALVSVLAAATLAIGWQRAAIPKVLPIPKAGPLAQPKSMHQVGVPAAATRAAIPPIPEYQDAFRKVFGGPPNARDLLRAIASYERTQLSFDSPFDRFIAGDSTAIDDAAKRGWEVFNTRARCNKCHALTEQTRDATYFTDNDFHNIGIGIIRHNVA